ncbi:pectinacetylesterase family protein [Candidatus Binatia bacterium]|nr:pectinacetylesterase family protein [Candidatus Binatia bacterium]
MRRVNRTLLYVLPVLVLAFEAPSGAGAATYPGNKCVAGKQRAAGTYCKAVLKAWAKWDKTQDTGKRTEALAKASGKLTEAWAKEQSKAAKQGVDCADTTVSAAAMQAAVDAATGGIVTGINTGLDFNEPDDARCGAALLGAAANTCAAYLKAEAGYVGKLEAGTVKRDAARSKALAKLGAAVTKATAGACPTGATAGSIDNGVDALAADVVADTIVSPNVADNQFVTITPSGPIEYQGQELSPVCALNTPYAFFAKRGSVNKLVMYYQGGGACWDLVSCSIPTCDVAVDPFGSDNPNNTAAGFGDMSNPDNPFKDWHVVFTSYCSCDVHFGDSLKDYQNDGSVVIRHRGYQNARVVEKWAREHFVNPEEIVVTGSSAGSYGAFFNAPLLQRVWPDSTFTVLGDGGNGVITSDFLNTPGYGFQNWEFERNLPPDIPGVQEAITGGEGIKAYTVAVAAHLPDVAWAHYTTAYDGGTGGQTGFYNVMLNPNNPFTWLNWWNASCDWNAEMVQQAHEAYATISATPADNYRYYIGRGSRHTGWGADNVVYSADAIGGSPALPALKDWVNSMRARDAGWVNVECTNCGRLRSGDPKPSPLQSPFQQNGSDVDIVCP